MTSQAQPDIEFINLILSSEGKKITDRFKLNRLKQAVQAYVNLNVTDSVVALVDYHCYVNEPDMAWHIIQEALKNSGYSEQLVIPLLRTSHMLGSWEKIKYAWNLYFENHKLEDMSLPIRSTFIGDCNLYIDTSIVPMHLKTLARELLGINSDKISLYLEQLNECDISLRTYQKVIEKALNIIHSYYVVHAWDHKTKFTIDGIVIYVSNQHLTDKDAIMMAQELDDRILQDEDIDFQLEADNIQVIFTNKNLDDIPQDFNPFAEDENEDKALIELVKNRMATDSKDAIEIELN